MIKLLVSPDAQADLDQIRAYIENESGEPEAGQKQIARITQRLWMLQEQPQMGAPLVAQVHLMTDYRYLVCGSYYAFYKVYGDEVSIVRILHCSMDFVRVLFGISAN